jgi:hypothetical protein
MAAIRALGEDERHRRPRLEGGSAARYEPLTAGPGRPDERDLALGSGACADPSRYSCGGPARGPGNPGRQPTTIDLSPRGAGHTGGAGRGATPVNGARRRGRRLAWAGRPSEAAGGGTGTISSRDASVACWIPTAGSRRFHRHQSALAQAVPMSPPVGQLGAHFPGGAAGPGPRPFCPGTVALRRLGVSRRSHRRSVRPEPCRTSEINSSLKPPGLWHGPG